MPTAKELKAEIKKNGIDTKGIRIRVEYFEEFVWIKLKDMTKANEIKEIICQKTGLKPYEMNVSELG